MKGVIFDLDGTLLDSMGTWHNCGARYLKSIGVEAEPGLGDFLFTQTNHTGALFMAEHYGLDMDPSEIEEGMNREMEHYYGEESELKEGARELLDQFDAAGIPMVIASSTDRYLINKAMTRLDMGHYFVDILTCSELGTTKAEPLIFNRAADRMNTAPEETWVFEDGLYALKTAAATGFRTAAVFDEISESDWDEMKALADVHLEDLRYFRIPEK